MDDDGWQPDGLYFPCGRASGRPDGARARRRYDAAAPPPRAIPDRSSTVPNQHAAADPRYIQLWLTVTCVLTVGLLILWRGAEEHEENGRWVRPSAC